MSIKIENVSYTYYGNEKKTLYEINLNIPKGSSLALFGSSGSGKSTLLNLITSFLKLQTGKIFINDTLINEVSTKYNISYIRQSPNDMVYPWKTVLTNLLFPLKLRKTNNNHSEKLINDLLKQVKLEDKKKKYPHQLSIGQQKKLSIACGLCYDPDILLLDEVFSGIDLPLKFELWHFLRNKILTNKITTFIITHDFDEALYFADNILILTPEGNIHDSNFLIDKLLKLEYKTIEEYLSCKKIVEIKKRLIETFKTVYAYE